MSEERRDRGEAQLVDRGGRGEEEKGGRLGRAERSRQSGHENDGKSAERGAQDLQGREGAVVVEAQHRHGHVGQQAIGQRELTLADAIQVEASGGPAKVGLGASLPRVQVPRGRDERGEAGPLHDRRAPRVGHEVGIVVVGVVHRRRAQDESEEGEGGDPAGRLVAQETGAPEAAGEEDRDDPHGQSHCSG